MRTEEPRAIALKDYRAPDYKIPEIALAIGKTFNEVVRIFDLLGVRPASWESPSDYRVSDILESASRHEVSARTVRL